MQTRFPNVVGFLSVVVALISVIEFGCIWIDYGWRGIPSFLALDWLAWLAFLKGLLATFLLLAVIAVCFMKDPVLSTVDGVHDGA